MSDRALWLDEVPDLPGRAGLTLSGPPATARRQIGRADGRVLLK